MNNIRKIFTAESAEDRENKKFLFGAVNGTLSAVKGIRRGGI